MKKIILSLLMLLPMMAQAQDFDFNEVVYSPAKTTFRLFAPRDGKPKVMVFKDAAKLKGAKSVMMKYLPEGYWEAEIKGDLKDQFYAFQLTGVKNAQPTPGVFAKAVSVNGKYGAIVDLRETDPELWDKDRKPRVKTPADLVIYEMHHRDFSIDASSGLTYKGKYLALTEAKAIDHLKELGINAVHILPSYDYGSVDETRLSDNKYNWGYDPVNYNVPEGGYSTDPYNPKSRISEFKQMVQALHKAGINVILDVVYNHTYDIDHSNFQRTYPDYYYRKNADGTYSNGSGCGNETASDKPMMRRFMIESVKYWMQEYHIDGFRFDLMGIHDIETMNAIRQAVDEIDPTVFIYGEGWSAGSCAYPGEKLGLKANIPQMPGIAAFSDEIRDALRGPFSDDTKGGFLAGVPDTEESVKFGIVGAISHPQIDMTKVNYSSVPWALQPTQMISYVSCHDDMCLVDRLKASVPSLKTSDGKLSESQMEELIRLDLLAQTAVFTSQAVPFMLSGEEMLRDKKGVHNSFESPDSINHLDWDNLKRYPQVFDYYKNLIALRKLHPAFRMGSADMVRQHLEFLDAPKQVVAFRLKNYAGRDDWRTIIVILNASKEEQTIAVPQGDYIVNCANGVITVKSRGLSSFSGNTATVAPQSALIIHN